MSTSAILRNQPSSEERLPKIGRHVTSTVVAYEDDRALLVIKLTGMPFESIENKIVANRFNTRNRVFASLAKDKGKRLAIWTTFKRQKVSLATKYEFKSAFMRQFSQKYLAKFHSTKYFENTFYIALVLKHDDVTEGAAELEEIGKYLMKSFSEYDPEYLVTYEKDGVQFSQVYRYLGGLLNGVEEEIPVLAAPAAEVIPSSWLHFGYELLEIRAENCTRHAVSYDMKDFPDTTKWGQFDKLLALPAEFTLTQSFLCMGIFEAQKAITSQINKLNSVGDKAAHQIVELENAIGYISSGELAFGEYHAALTVYGDTDAQAKDSGTAVVGAFLGECGARFIKATLSAPWTYLSHIPGAKVKPRPMMKSSRNLAAAFGMHNYSTGKSAGNPIGDGSAILPLQTISSSLYSFNFHASTEKENNVGEKFAGHTLLLGSSGTGKTTTETAVVGFLTRFDPMIFALDKFQGLKPFLTGIGGVYHALSAGVPTNMRPFQLPPTPQTKQFLYALVGTCGKNENGTVTSEEGLQIKTAVDTVLRLDVQYRQFSRLLDTITDVGGNCLAQRLAKWCYREDGEYAWALDNVGEGLVEVNHRIVGYDVSDFLVPDYAPTEPLLAYLLHLKSLMQANGGLMASIYEEFYIPASYPTTAKVMFEGLKTGRQADEFLILASQSPEDAIDSPIFPAIRDQVATMILLPNPSAEFESYSRVGLTRKEFDALQALDKSSRTFLIKQGNQSCFAKLDLYGMDDEISILSGNKENVAILNQVMAEVGTDPDVWLPVFQARRKGKKQLVEIREEIFADAKNEATTEQPQIFADAKSSTYARSRVPASAEAPTFDFGDFNDAD